jgi:hypothetical protein
MTRRGPLRVVCWWAVALLAAGCGNEQKASTLLMVDGLSRHPELQDAVQRMMLAEVIAALDLDKATAQALRAWAAEHGPAIRGELDRTFVGAADELTKAKTAARLMVQRRASDYLARQAIMGEHQLDPKDPLRLEAKLPRPDAEGPPPTEFVKPAVLATLAPLVGKLSDEQRMAIVGTWEEAVKAVVEYQTAKGQAAIDEARGKVTVAVAQCLGGDAVVIDDKLAARLKPVFAKIKTGQAKARNPEEDLRALLDQLPAPKPEQQKPATRALAHLLALPAAVPMLDAVP